MYLPLLLNKFDALLILPFSQQVKSERLEKWLKSYWQEIIEEQKKDSIKRKRTVAKDDEKENLKPSSIKRPRSIITLICLVQGNPFTNAFPIDISKDQLIGHLKEAIKAKKQNDFADIDADKLKLWKVEISDDYDNQLNNLSPQDQDELLATKKVLKYFSTTPVEEHIHIIVSPPESIKANQEQELMDQIANLPKLLKSVYEFDVIVKPKRTKGFKWIINIEQVTLKSLKESIHIRYQTLDIENDGAVLNFVCDNGNYSPQSDLEFRNMLKLLISQNSLKFTVNIETTLSFSLWTFPKMCKLYGIGADDPSLSDFPLFTCKCVELNDEKSQVIIKHLITDLRYRIKAIPINRNEASRSQYVCAYLIAVANLFENKLEVHPEKNVSGLNGHGPVDFGLVLLQTSRLAGITEVKDKDFLQGIAQNAVQCESSLSYNKQNVFGIITDAEKWYFLECSLSNQKPKFKLSKPVVVVYGDEDMEDRVKKVLGHIAWLLEEAQKLDGTAVENLKVKVD